MPAQEPEPLSVPLYIGTMGWSYEDWSGTFYPNRTPLRESLPVYSQAFDAVEIDSTFYGTPRESQVHKWYQSTPEGFRFCPKVPRLFTHDMALRDVEVPLAEYFRVMSQLKEKCGAILFQFPASFTRNELSNIENLLPKLESLCVEGQRFAMEFRHRSLITSDVSDLLRSHNVALVSADYVGMPRRFELTTDFVYLRLIGKHGSFEHHKETQTPKQEHLERWAEVLRSNQSHYERAYVFCNNDYEGYSPATCNRLKTLLGQNVRTAPAEIQGTLF